MPLYGQHVILREERAEDMPRLVELRNDLETQAWSQTLPPDYTVEMYLKRFQAREFSFDREDGRFIVVSKESGEFAGYLGYTGLQPRWSAVIGIMVARKFWGSGFANDAQEVLLRFLFEELGLRVVRLFTHSGNPRAVKLAERAGFRVSLRQRESIFKGGARYDNLMMDLLREEYYARHPELEDRLPGLEGG
jgi:RimJ/RimL family protein N-acetyltransferase